MLFLSVPLLLCMLLCHAHSSCSCLSVSTIILCLFVVFTYAICMGATVHTLVSAPPLTLHTQFQQLFFSSSLPACTYTCKRQFHEVVNSSAQALTLGRSGDRCQMMRHNLHCVSSWWGLPSAASSPSLTKTTNTGWLLI